MHEHVEKRNLKEFGSTERRVLCTYENRKPEEEYADSWDIDTCGILKNKP
jgi:hypothetical protein